MNNNKKTKNKFLNGLLTATSLASIMLGATSASGAEAVTNGAATLAPAGGGAATGFAVAWVNGDSIKSGGAYTIDTINGVGAAYNLIIQSMDTNAQASANTLFTLVDPGVGNDSKVTIGSITNTGAANRNNLQNITFGATGVLTLVLNGDTAGAVKNDYSALGTINFANKQAKLQVTADDNGGNHNIIFASEAATNTEAKVSNAGAATLEVGGVDGGKVNKQTNLIVQNGSFSTMATIIINPQSKLIFDGSPDGVVVGTVVLNQVDPGAGVGKGVIFGGDAGDDSGTLILKTKNGAGAATAYNVRYGSLGGKNGVGGETDLHGNITFDVSLVNGSLKTSDGAGGTRDAAIIGIDSTRRANLFKVVTGVNTADIQGKIYAKNLVFDGGAAGAAKFASIVDTGVNGTTTFKTGPVALTFAQKATLGTIATDAGAQTSILKFTAGGSLSGSTGADPAVTISTISNNAAEEITVGGNLTVTDDGLKFLVANGTFKIADGAVITAAVTTTAAGNLTFIKSGKLIGDVAAATALTTLNFTATGGEANVQFDGTVNSTATIFTSNGTNAIFNGDATLGIVSGANLADSTLTFGGAGNSSLNINNANKTVKEITLIRNGTVEFKGDNGKKLSLTNGLAFKSADGTVELGAGVLLAGNVTNINPAMIGDARTPSGKLKINAIADSVTGDIGAANARLAELKFFTNAGTATFTPVNGSIYTMATEFNTNNTQNYRFNNITDLGTITTAGGGQTSTLEFNAGGSLSAVIGGTTIGKITNNAADTVTIGGNITPTNGLIASNAGAVFSLENNTTITGDVDNSTGAAGGTLKFLGIGTVSGNVGASAAYNLVQVGNGVAQIGGTLNSVDINFNDATGSLKISDAATITGGVTGGHGTLIFGNTGTVALASSVGEVQVGTQNVIFSNTLRTSGDVKFNNNGKSLTITGLATIGGNVIGSGGNDNKLILKAGGTVTGNIQGLGELTFDSAAAATFTVNGTTNTAETIFTTNGINAIFNGDAVLGIVSGDNLANSTLTFGGAGNSSLNINNANKTVKEITLIRNGTVEFKGDNGKKLSLTNGLAFKSADGTVELGAGVLLAGNVTNINPAMIGDARTPSGKLKINAIADSVTGDIGAANARLAELKFFTNAGTATFTPVNGSIYTMATEFNTNNTQNYSFNNITDLGTITTAGAGARASTLKFNAGGSLSGGVGTTIGKITNNAADTVIIGGNITPTNGLIASNVGAVFSLKNNTTISGDVDTSGGAGGTLQFLGIGTVTGNVGASAAYNLVQVGNGVAQIGGTLNSVDINFNDATGSLKISDAATITGGVTGGHGTLIFGNTGTVALASSVGEVQVGTQNVIFSNTLRTSGDVKFNNNGKSLTITGLATIGGNVIGSGGNDNKLILKAGGTVTGNIQGLSELKFESVAAATFTVNGTTNTAKTIFTGNGTNAIFNDDAALGIVSGDNLANSTLIFGGAGNSSLNTGAVGIALSSISNNGTGTVSLQGGNTITSSLQFTNAGTIAIENNTNFTGNATTSIAGQGVLNFLGTSDFAGNIGAAGSAIGELKFSGAAGTVNVIGTVDTEKTSLYDAFALNFQNKTALKKVTTINNGTKSIIQFTNVGSLQGDNTTLKQISNNSGNVVTIAGSWFGSEKNTALLLLNYVDSEFNLSDNISIDGSVQTAVDNQGTLYFSGNGKITGNIGKNTEKLAKVTVTQGTVELSGVYAKILHFEKAALIKIVAAGTIDGAVTTSANGVGTLSFLGTNSTISGNIGENFRGLDEVIVTNGLTVGTATANVAELYAKKLTLGGTLDLASNSNNSNIVVINNVNVTKDAVLSQNITSTVNESLNLGTHSLTFNGSSEWGKDSSEFTIYTTLSNDNTLGKLIINAPVTTNDKVPLEINVTDTALLGNKELLFIEVGKPNNLNEGKTVDFPLGGNIVSNQRYAGYVITKNANGNYYLGVKDDSTEKIIEDLTAANATDLQKENALLIANATTGDALATRDDLGRQNPKAAAEAIERLEEGAPIQTTDNVLSQTTLAVDYLISNRVSDVSIPNVGDNLNSKPVASGDEVRTPMGVWVQPLYIQSTQTTSTNVSGYTSKSTGGVFGLDTMANEDFIVGGALSLIKTTMKFDGVKQGDKNTINSLGVSFYADQKLPRNFSIQAIAGFGSSKVQTSSKRLVSKEIDASGSQTASGKYNSRYYGGQVMVTYGAKISDTMLFTPQAGLSYSAFSNSSYTETGTTTQNLIVRNTKGSNNIQGIIGGRVQLFHNTNEFLLTPEMHAFLYQSLRSNQGTVSSQLSGMNSAFITAPSKINTLLNVGFSLNAKHQQMDYSIGYDLITASKGYKANAANLKVRINF